MLSSFIHHYAPRRSQYKHVVYSFDVYGNTRLLVIDQRGPLGSTGSMEWTRSREFGQKWALALTENVTVRRTCS